MSDYTPSTRKVRAAYVHGIGGSTWYEGKAEALKESFDRWLAEVKAQAWEEGFQDGHDSAMGVRNTDNPYWQEKTDANL